MGTIRSSWVAARRRGGSMRRASSTSAACATRSSGPPGRSPTRPARYSAGYRDLAGRFTHERTLVFVRPDYWLLFDEVRDEDGGDAAHLVESLFHFMPMRLQVDRASARVRTHRQMKPNLELIPLGQARGLGVTVVCGQHAPVQGWVSIDRRISPRRASPTAAGRACRSAWGWRSARTWSAPRPA